MPRASQLCIARTAVTTADNSERESVTGVAIFFALLKHLVDFDSRENCLGLAGSERHPGTVQAQFLAYNIHQVTLTLP